MRALLANLGFFSQMAGIFMVFPVIAAVFYKETPATIALLITAIIFFVLGFFLNTLCEKKDLDFKDSSRLFVLSFVMLGVIGGIPYFYVHATDGGFTQRVTDSIFESVSGYTTTGFSVISDPSKLPQSIVLYRGLTQFIGGIGIILLLIIFFYSEDRLNNFSRSFGIENNGRIKKTFIMIALVYTGIIVFTGIIAYLSGYHNIINLLSYLFAAVSGGGFTPVVDISKEVIGTSFGYLIMIAMILGASHLIIIAGLFTLKFKEFLRSEVPVYFGLIFAGFLFVKFMFGLGYFEALFHVVSAFTNTGFQYANFPAFSDSLKLTLIVMMMIGGTSVSAAGGIKVFRLGVIFASIKKSIYAAITEEDKKIKVFDKEYSNQDIVQNYVIVVLMVGIAFLSAIIFTAGGNTFVNSLFITTSAIATTGLDVGLIIGLGLAFKWLLVLLMLLGRVEVFAFLIIFSRVNEKSKKQNSQI